MRRKIFVFLLVSGALLGGCTSKICSKRPQAKVVPSKEASQKTNTPLKGAETGSARDVRIVTAEPDPRICDYIDDTMGSSIRRNLAEAQLEARQELKDNAFALGGNTVRLDTSTVDEPGLTRGQIVLNGRVYKCNLSVNPEALLGPINRDLANQPRTDLEGPNPSNSSPGTQDHASSSSGQRQPQDSQVNPPPEPGKSFDEKAFLHHGEGEFEG